jgi:hypothetical protein
MKRCLCFLFIVCLSGVGFFSCSDDGGDDDNTENYVEISNIHNNSIVKTGFMLGTVSNADIIFVEVSIDGGSYVAAEGTTEWTYKLPCGVNTWLDFSSHSISVRGVYADGSTTEPLTISVKKGINSDYNGDGYCDVIVGASGYDDHGAAFVYYGSAEGQGSYWAEEGTQSSEYFGGSVSSAGDVNGDGYADALIGAPRYENGKNDESAAFVYYGSASGLGNIPDWSVESNQDSPGFAGCVSSAGDVNGDGYSDIIIGASNYNNGTPSEGAVLGYYGSASGLSSSHDWIVDSAGAYNVFGSRISSAGDVNGDGYSEVIVSEEWYSGDQNEEGAVYLYYGSSSGLCLLPGWTAEGNQAYARLGYAIPSAGDVNGDGYSDVILGGSGNDNDQPNEGIIFVYYGSSAGLNLTAGWTGEGNEDGLRLGESASSAGDINNDGYHDIIAGTTRYSNGQTNEGMVLVYYGSANGPGSNPEWYAESNQEDSGFGYSISSAGDINGDGFSDVIFGASRYDNGETNEGMIFLFLGSGSGLSASADWTAEVNDAYAYFGSSVSD